jgi:uncharacterized membrane protein
MKTANLDAVAILVSGALLLLYYLFLWARVRRNPEFSIHRVNRKVRLLWVRDVMQNRSKDVMAVQTLRNMAMGAIFKASSAILLILGALTLSGQAENMTKTWHVLSLAGSPTAGWWTVKILCLLTVLIIAFFAFSMAIRLLNHVVFMVNLPQEAMSGLLTPENIAHQLNGAGTFYTIGMRAYFIAVPLVFWLFGPLFLLGATVGLIGILYYLDHNPMTSQD